DGSRERRSRFAWLGSRTRPVGRIATLCEGYYSRAGGPRRGEGVRALQRQSPGWPVLISTPLGSRIRIIKPAPQRTHELFQRTLDWLHAAGQPRTTSGVVALRAKASFAAWMILRTATHSQASGHRLSAVARLCMWQLWRKLPRAGAIAQLSDGA